MLDRTIAPQFSLPQHINMPTVIKKVLDNGMVVHLFDNTTLPAIKIEAVIPVGSVDAANPAVSYFALKMLSEGTKRRSATEIAEMLDFLGAYLEINTSFDHSTVAVYGLKRDTVALASLLYELLEESSLPHEEFEKLKRIKIESLLLDSKKTSAVASKQLRAQMFGNHPYGRLLEMQDINDTECLLAAKAFYEQNVKSNYELLVSCSLDENAALAINNIFGGVGFGQTTISYNGEAGKNIAGVIPVENLLPFENSVQSSLRLGCLMPHKRHADFTGIFIANKLLGGFFGSRLMKSIREDLGLTYGISSSIIPLAQTSMLFIGADIKEGMHKETVEAVKVEISRLRDTLVSESELEVLKNYMIGSLTTKLNNPFAIADAYRDLMFFGQDLTHYDKMLDEVSAMTSIELQRIYQTYFHTEQLHVVATVAK